MVRGGCGGGEVQSHSAVLVVPRHLMVSGSLTHLVDSHSAEPSTLRATVLLLPDQSPRRPNLCLPSEFLAADRLASAVASPCLAPSIAAADGIATRDGDREESSDSGFEDRVLQPEDLIRMQQGLSKHSMYEDLSTGTEESSILPSRSSDYHTAFQGGKNPPSYLTLPRHGDEDGLDRSFLAMRDDLQQHEDARVRRLLTTYGSTGAMTANSRAHVETPPKETESLPVSPGRQKQRLEESHPPQSSFLARQLQKSKSKCRRHEDAKDAFPVAVDCSTMRLKPVSSSYRPVSPFLRGISFTLSTVRRTATKAAGERTESLSVPVPSANRVYCHRSKMAHNPRQASLALLPRPPAVRRKTGGEKPHLGFRDLVFNYGSEESSEPYLPAPRSGLENDQGVHPSNGQTEEWDGKETARSRRGEDEHGTELSRSELCSGRDDSLQLPPRPARLFAVTSPESTQSGRWLLETTPQMPWSLNSTLRSDIPGRPTINFVASNIASTQSPLSAAPPRSSLDPNDNRTFIDSRQTEDTEATNGTPPFLPVGNNTKILPEQQKQYHKKQHKPTPVKPASADKRKLDDRKLGGFLDADALRMQLQRQVLERQRQHEEQQHRLAKARRRETACFGSSN